MKKNIIYICLIIISLSACKNSKTSQPAESSSVQQSTSKTFTLPEIPVMLTDPEQRADFLAKHYWDNFDFADTTSIQNSEMVEQAWVDYINILNHVPLETATVTLKKTFEKAGNNKTIFDHFTNLADKYLHDPNSPFRNEEFYIPVLETIVSSPLLNDTDKIRPADRLNMAFKNRLGTRAANFTYTLQSGKQGTLNALSTNYILVYFNNPGCHACEEITTGLKESLQIQYLLSKKQLTILAIYPDEDLDEWRNHQHDFPKEWINGYDKGESIRMQNLYDLKAIPTLYLLDKNKTVLIKDGTFDQIENYFRHMN